MTKKIKESSCPTLFDWLKEAQQIADSASNPKPGSLAGITREFKQALTDDVKAAVNEKGMELSRYQIVARMSDLLDEEITKTTLDNWTAQSHPHEIPPSALAAFVIATGGQRRAFEVLSRHSGLFALPGPEALRAEIQRDREAELKARSHRQRKEVLLKEIEGKKE